MVSRPCCRGSLCRSECLYAKPLQIRCQQSFDSQGFTHWHIFLSKFFPPFCLWVSVHRLLRLPSRLELSKSRRPLAPPPMPYPTYHAVLPSLTVLPLGTEFCPFACCRSLPRPLPHLSFETSNWFFTGCFSSVANPVDSYSPSESKLLTRESPSSTICLPHPHPHPQRDTVLSPIPSTHLPSSD